jgi:hypothetical protein
MRKITLDMNKLNVESFAAEAPAPQALNDCTFGACTTPCILPTCEEYAC